VCNNCNYNVVSCDFIFVSNSIMPHTHHMGFRLVVYDVTHTSHEQSRSSSHPCVRNHQLLTNPCMHQ
jgi:hypothetical protein